MEEAPFRQASGLSHRRFFKRLHSQRVFDWYMEIGCRSGRIFESVRGKTIAVDPYFKINIDVIGEKPQLHIIQKKSDDFFATDFIKANDIRVSVTFIDGMHLFEFLLRDFFNSEQASSKDGVILMHDCCPFGYEMCTRDLGNLPSGVWTGDVWKLIPILQKWRPDLQVDVLDCKPTGLVVVSNLDPCSKVLTDAFDAIVSEWRDVTLETWGVGQFNKQFTFQDGKSYLVTTSVFDAITLSAAAHTAPSYVTP